jgi:hypothetical protein
MEVKMKEFQMHKDWTNRQINSMITYLRVHKIAEIQFIEINGNVMEHWETGEYTLYDYMRNSRVLLSQVISSAIDSGWTEDWVV